MVRNTAREIAIHLSYELNFSGKTAEELLDQRFDDRRMERIYPNAIMIE